MKALIPDSVTSEIGFCNVRQPESVTMRGGVLEAMIDLGNMRIPGNLVVNIPIMFNMLILILLEYEILSSPDITQVMKMWRMMKCPSQITS